MSRKGGRDNYQFLIIGLSIIDNRNYRIWSISDSCRTSKVSPFFQNRVAFGDISRVPEKAVIFSDNGEAEILEFCGAD
jgi:hypothetical protein